MSLQILGENPDALLNKNLLTKQIHSEKEKHRKIKSKKDDQLIQNKQYFPMLVRRVSTTVHSPVFESPHLFVMH